MGKEYFISVQETDERGKTLFFIHKGCYMNPSGYHYEYIYKPYSLYAYQCLRQLVKAAWIQEKYFTLELNQNEMNECSLVLQER